MWQVVRTGVLMALVIEVFQLFVFSRVTDSTDVLLAAFGVGIGAQLVASWTHAQAMPLDAVPRSVWGVLWWCWFLVVLAVFINGTLVLMLMLYPLRLIIVREAATDNLTELLADQGSLLSLV